MAIYCHDCASLFYENKLLKRLLAEVLVVRENKQPCLNTANGMPMGMGAAKERRVRKILKDLREMGSTLCP
jgi:hypothetical protein